jgi:hypothetical protein
VLLCTGGYCIGGLPQRNALIAFGRGVGLTRQDESVELDALRTLGARGDLEPVVAQKILDENPRALYGL